MQYLLMLKDLNAQNLQFCMAQQKPSTNIVAKTDRVGVFL